ncbi:MAG: Lrp/AsnC ligand binding domain-containing protein [Anaerolineae bacterium]|nr:Lrp/AsnC ligand binding domain-containing protein [Anaerolineae bacterium]
MKAYVLINTRIGAIAEVVRNLRRVPSVQSAEMTFGEYDLIAVVSVADLDTLAKVISREIQTIPDVTHTITCLAVDVTK